MTGPLTYTADEVAAMIPCRRRWLVDRLAEGTFTGLKIQNEWRMTAADIEDALAKCRRRTGHRAARLPSLVGDHRKED